MDRLTTKLEQLLTESVTDIDWDFIKKNGRMAERVIGNRLVFGYIYDGEFYYKDRTGSVRSTVSRGTINEVAPPGMEDWVKKNKERFKKEYGSDYKSKLYATAWKMHNESVEDSVQQLPDTQAVPQPMKLLTEISKSGAVSEVLNVEYDSQSLIATVTDSQGATYVVSITPKYE